MANTFRIALANIRFPESPAASVELARNAVAEASVAGAGLVCFPECFVPGYRSAGRACRRPSAAFLEGAWAAVADAAARAQVTVVLGTERLVAGTLVASALVINPDGTTAGFQDKVQIDPVRGADLRARHRAAGLSAPDRSRSGSSICHEGWRYPETVRWAARRGAQVVFHPQFHEAEPGDLTGPRPSATRRTRSTKRPRCAGRPRTPATSRPSTTRARGRRRPRRSCGRTGRCSAYQPYGREGLLVADLDLSKATGLLAQAVQADILTRCACMGSPSENIRDARVRAGLEPEDVARAVGLNKPWYYDVEGRDDEVTDCISLATLMTIHGLWARRPWGFLEGPDTSAVHPSNPALI